MLKQHEINNVCRAIHRQARIIREAIGDANACKSTANFIEAMQIANEEIVKGIGMLEICNCLDICDEPQFRGAKRNLLDASKTEC